MDDWTNVPEGIVHDIPVVVGVKVGENFIKCPSHYVLISLEDEDCEGNRSLHIGISQKSQFLNEDSCHIYYRSHCNS